MSLYIPAEQRQAGEQHYTEAVNRRGFLKGVLATAGAAGLSTTAAYFGYKALEGNPVKVGLIGAGDEGGVLVGEHNPEYLEFIAYSDIRPYNQKRIFKGDLVSPRGGHPRLARGVRHLDVVGFDAPDNPALQLGAGHRVPRSRASLTKSAPVGASTISRWHTRHTRPNGHGSSSPPRDYSARS